MHPTQPVRCSVRAATILVSVLLGVHGSAFAQAPPLRVAPIKSTPQATQKRNVAKVETRQPIDFSLEAKADLLVGMRVLVDPSEPAGHGEFPVVFRTVFTVTDDQYKQANVWVPFRWRTDSPIVRSVEWQVVTTPISDSLDDWEYPAGIVARGRVDAPESAGKDAYFVIDFRKLRDLPPGFVLMRPALRRRVSATGRTSAEERAAPPLRVVRDRAPVSAKLGLSAAVLQQFAAKKVRFTSAMGEIVKRRSYYVRIVLLGAGGTPVGASGYVTVKSGSPSKVVIYEDLLPPPVVAQDVNPPKFSITSYSGPYDFSPGTATGHYVVLGNCPKMFLNMWHCKPGDKVYLKPGGDSGGVLDKIGDAVGSVFSSVGDLVNWFAHTWDDLKASLVNGICFGNEDCATVAMPLLNTGLAALGIPPEIPTFNDLCGLGADYLAAYIASQSAIPEDVAKAGLRKMADVVNNPPGGSGGAFLWPDPAFQNRPAMVTLEVWNPGQEVTDPVVVNLGYGASQGEDSGYTHLPTFLDSSTPIPPLFPGQRLRVPVFLSVNPNIKISHGADSQQGYFRRDIEIFDLDRSSGSIAFSSANWFQHDVTLSH